MDWICWFVPSYFWFIIYLSQEDSCYQKSNMSAWLLHHFQGKKKNQNILSGKLPIKRLTLLYIFLSPVSKFRYSQIEHLESSHTVEKPGVAGCSEDASSYAQEQAHQQDETIPIPQESGLGEKEAGVLWESKGTKGGSGKVVQGHIGREEEQLYGLDALNLFLQCNALPCATPPGWTAFCSRLLMSTQSITCKRDFSTEC